MNYLLIKIQIQKKSKKITYLKSLVSGAAANTISGFGLTENNYAAAVSLFKERCGRYDMLLNVHLRNLLNMKGLKSSYDTSGLRNLYDKCLVLIRNMEALYVNPDTYSGLLCLLLLNFMPIDLTIEFNKNLKDDEMWNIDKLMSFLKNEVESGERVSIIHDLDTKKYFSNDYKAEYRPKFTEEQTKYKPRY